MINAVCSVIEFSKLFSTYKLNLLFFEISFHYPIEISLKIPLQVIVGDF